MRYQGKRVIWKSKGKQWQLVFFCALFVIAILFIGKQSSPPMFWTGLVFFGGGGVAMLVIVLWPSNLFVKPGSALAEEVSRKIFTDAPEDIGIFDFTDAGFFFSNGKTRSYFEWSQVTAVFAYKAAVKNYDVISLDLFTATGKGLTLTEEMSGWYFLKEGLKQQFPSVPANWDKAIIDIPIDTSLTLLYDKDGRSLSEASPYYYQ